jgi:hypothetical protein
MTGDAPVPLDEFDDPNIPTVYLPYRAEGWTTEVVLAKRDERRRLRGGTPLTERIIILSEGEEPLE